MTLIVGGRAQTFFKLFTGAEPQSSLFLIIWQRLTGLWENSNHKTSSASWQAGNGRNYRELFPHPPAVAGGSILLPPCPGRRLISSVPAAVLRPRARNTLRAKKHPPEAATHLSHPLERSLFGHQRFFKYEVCGQIILGIIIWRKSTTTIPRKEPLTRVLKDFSMSRSSLGNEERGDFPGARTLDPKGTYRQRAVGKLLQLKYKLCVEEQVRDPGNADQV